MVRNTHQPKPKKSTKKPLQKATVIERALKHRSKSTSEIDKNILDRIQKCLNRAHHANTSEAEAKAALFVSQKLMSQHNVTQADLMAADKNDNKAHYGGRSIVRITKIGGSSDRVKKEAFTRTLARAMCTLFDCKCFSTDYRTRIEWTFFGIADNTVAAAMGFEMAHDKILEWACAYKGGSPTYSYRVGVADGLEAMAIREKRRELEDVKRKEIDSIAAKEREEVQERQAELDRLRLLPDPFDSGSSDSDSESGIDQPAVKADFNLDDMEIIDLCDVDDTIERFMKREPSEPLGAYRIPQFRTEPEPRIKLEAESKTKPVVSPWNSGMQLVRFRATSEQVADDYLKQEKIKLRHHRSRSSFARDRDAYRQGQRDSAKINVRRKEV